VLTHADARLFSVLTTLFQLDAPLTILKYLA